MAADLLIRNIQLETNKLYQFETRMKSNIDEKRKTFHSLKEHANAAQNRFHNSRQFESSKDGVIEGTYKYLVLKLFLKFVHNCSLFNFCFSMYVITYCYETCKSADFEV